SRARRRTADGRQLPARGRCGARRRDAASRQRVQGRAREADDRSRAAARGRCDVTAVGAPVERVDAKLKVTGRATYAAETPVANVAPAVIVGSAIGRGVIRSLVTASALKAPGVIAVLTHDNAPRLPPAPPPKGPGDRVLQLLQDDSVLYQDQPIAVVV